MSVLMIVFSILMIIGGVICMATPVATFSMLGWPAGLSIIISGVSAVFRYASGRSDRSVWELVGGIAGILFGGFIVVNAFAQIATNAVSYTHLPHPPETTALPCHVIDRGAAAAA